jgi:SP family sugar:H+ symporter-like MFS transporter
MPNLDSTYLKPGARGINKKQEARVPEEMRREDVPPTEADMEASGSRR